MQFAFDDTVITALHSHSKRTHLTAHFRLGGREIARYDLALEPGQTKIVGNMWSAADVRVDAEVVSRNHLLIMVDENEQMQICDTGSSNGTLDGDRELAVNRWHPVGPRSHILLGGEVLMSLELHQPAPHIPPSGERTLAELIEHKVHVTIGRGKECDLVLDDPLVSRQHALVIRDANDNLLIKDLNSANGTFVNGKRVQGPAQLAADTPIFIGKHVIKLGSPPVDMSKECAVRTHGAVRDHRGGKRGLHPTDIEIETGSMTAIMGPSGCGKSTLLKVLNGDMPPTGGKVEIFGVDLISGHEYLRSVIGYVPQDDIVHRELTVQQAVYYAARLRLEHLDAAETYAKVEDVLRELRISHIKQHLIGSISGGQRKRVCIAVELLSSPLILFLDEPTSPLDPQSVEEFLSILEGLANQGTTVVMVTHKPEDLEFMDKVIFMAEGGHVVFAGPTSDYLSWFEVRRTTEVYASLVGSEKDHWCAKYNFSKSALPAPAQSTRIKLRHSLAAPLRQFYWLARRYARIKTNDRVNTLLMIGQAPLIAGLICLIFAQVTPAVPFLIVISAIWLGTNNASRAIVDEQAIFKRERMFNLRLSTYLGSKILVLGFFALLQSGLLIGTITLGYALRGTELSWTSPGNSFIWLSVVCLAGTLMGLLASSALDNLEKVMTLVPLVLIPQIMLAGSITRISNWFVELLSYLTVSRWGNEGMNIIQRDIHVELPRPATASATEVLQANLGSYYHDLFGKLAGEFSLDVSAIIILCAIFAFCTGLNLKARVAIQ